MYYHYFTPPRGTSISGTSVSGKGDSGSDSGSDIVSRQEGDRKMEECRLMVSVDHRHAYAYRTIAEIEQGMRGVIEHCTGQRLEGGMAAWRNGLEVRVGSGKV